MTAISLRPFLLTPCLPFSPHKGNHWVRPQVWHQIWQLGQLGRLILKKTESHLFRALEETVLVFLQKGWQGLLLSSSRLDVVAVSPLLFQGVNILEHARTSPKPSDSGANCTQMPLSTKGKHKTRDRILQLCHSFRETRHPSSPKGQWSHWSSVPRLPQHFGCEYAWIKTKGETWRDQSASFCLLLYALLCFVMLRSSF